MARDDFQDRQLQQSRGQLEEPMAVGYGVIGAVLGLGGLGYALDRLFGTFPWLFVAGIVIGLGVWFVALAAALRGR